MLEKALESPLDCKEIQPVHSEGDQPWDFFGPDSHSSLLGPMSEPRQHMKTLLMCRRFKQRRFISHLWHGSTSGQVVGGGLPVTGSPGPLADGQEHLGRDKGGVGLFIHLFNDIWIVFRLGL